MAYDKETWTDPDTGEVWTNENWPCPEDRCYDCGSNIPGHHTPHCDFAMVGSILDLPEIPGTQWWADSPNRRYPAFRKVENA